MRRGRWGDLDYIFLLFEMRNESIADFGISGCISARSRQGVSFTEFVQFLTIDRDPSIVDLLIDSIGIPAGIAAVGVFGLEWRGRGWNIDIWIFISHRARPASPSGLRRVKQSWEAERLESLEAVKQRALNWWFILTADTEDAEHNFYFLTCRWYRRQVKNYQPFGHWLQLALVIKEMLSSGR